MRVRLPRAPLRCSGPSHACFGGPPHAPHAPHPRSPRSQHAGPEASFFVLSGPWRNRQRNRLLPGLLRVRFPPDLPLAPLGRATRRDRHARQHTLRDRLAAGRWSLNPERQVRILCPDPSGCALARPCSLTILHVIRNARRAKRVPLEARFLVTRAPDGRHLRHELTFQRSRMVRQPAVNRSSEGSNPSAGAFRPLEKVIHANYVGSNPTRSAGDVLSAWRRHCPFMDR